MSKAAKLSDYASNPALERELRRARELQLDVAAYEVAPGGIIRIFTTKAFPAQPRDEFEMLLQEGKL